MKSRIGIWKPGDGSFHARVDECIRRLEAKEFVSLGTLEILDPELPSVRVTSDVNGNLFVFFDATMWAPKYKGSDCVFRPESLISTNVGVMRGDVWMYPRMRDYAEAKKLFREFFTSLTKPSQEDIPAAGQGRVRA